MEEPMEEAQTGTPPMQKDLLDNGSLLALNCSCWLCWFLSSEGRQSIVESSLENISTAACGTDVNFSKFLFYAPDASRGSFFGDLSARGQTDRALTILTTSFDKRVPNEVTESARRCRANFGELKTILPIC